MSSIQIRPAVASDLEALVDLETRAMHFPMGHRVREWFRDDFPDDFRERLAVAEHEARLVAAAALLPMSFLYRGIRLRGAYWEAVVTDAAYRRQSLCRRLFDTLTPTLEVDARFVWGMTWLYRRFGYFPALRNSGMLDSGKRTIDVGSIPASTLDVRPAQPGDAPFIVRLRDEAAQRSIVSVPLSERRLRYDLREDRTVADRGELGLNRWHEWRILERGGRPVGFFMHDPWDLSCLMELEIEAGKASWHEAGAAALRATASFPRKPYTLGTVPVALPDTHPLFRVFPSLFGSRSRPFGDIAATIPDAVEFLRRVIPALECSLARSPSAGWTGEISVSRIDDGVRLRFVKGQIAEVAPWKGAEPGEARVRLMPGRFEALAFGYLSLAAILAEDADCAADEEAQAILAALFPPGDSFLRPI